jgi:hypothetical protein
MLRKKKKQSKSPKSLSRDRIQEERDGKQR